jgi:hypothetical protein
MKDNLKKKYLKYKKKYFELKGGQNCPCKSYAGINETGYSHTCYITNLLEKKPEICTGKNYKQAGILSGRRWYRNCNERYDNHCPESLDQSEHERNIKEHEDREKVIASWKKQDDDAIIDKIRPTLPGRYLLFNIFARIKSRPKDPRIQVKNLLGYNDDAMSILAEWFRGYNNIAMKCNGSILDHMPIPDDYRGKITDNDIELMRQAVDNIPNRSYHNVTKHFRDLERKEKCKNN